ncbi:putative dolichyldiphosphatase [Tolypocladium ophioglossoides CBS 100239]|uniref:Dolichyldiphosphatase n=1 Tax=Tolypocladium ophioglossoides (strain CBS 100239) TaxID=1163406 RepID=A0A0L0NHQ6_TOLOC|nr:putative dolichyldiphosphatase [Tolypocladium ophioglossoides CBS 100239]
MEEACVPNSDEHHRSLTASTAPTMADAAMAPLASLSLTHVYYDPDDPISLLCAYLALLPQALFVVYATVIFSTREAEIALAFAGQLACEALNFALKRLIKEERPRRIHGKGYGMPSSHAQFVAFWSLSLALFLLVRHRPRAAGSAEKHHRPWSLAERVAVSLAGAAVATATAWSRTYLDYHTTRQVLVGSAAGIVSAVGWFVATSILRRSGLLAWALDTPPARAFRVRDLVVEEDMCQAGWEKWEERRAAASQGKAKTR